MFPPQIGTERLLLEQLRSETADVDELFRRFGATAPHAAEIFGQISDEPFDTEKAVVDFIDRAESTWDDGETGVYTVSPKPPERGDGDCAGYAHLWMDWGRKKAELGLLLDKPFWGREYATEVYLALTEAAFDLHGIEVVGIGHPVVNTKSERSIEKFIEAANGRVGGIVPNHEWVGDDLSDSRRYSVTKDAFSETG